MLSLFTVQPQNGEMGEEDSANTGQPIELHHHSEMKYPTSTTSSSLSTEVTSSRDLDASAYQDSSVTPITTYDKWGNRNTTANTNISTVDYEWDVQNQTDMANSTFLNRTEVNPTQTSTYSWTSQESRAVEDSSLHQFFSSLPSENETSSEASVNISSPDNSTGLRGTEPSLIESHTSVITDLPISSSTPLSMLSSTNHLLVTPRDEGLHVTMGLPPTVSAASSTILRPPHAPISPKRPSDNSGRHEIAGMDPLALGIGICIPILLVIVVVLSVFCYRK